MDAQLLTIDDFCASHGMCRRTFFNLQARGQAPETILVGKRRLITKDAVTAWRMSHRPTPEEVAQLRATAQAQESAGMAEMVEQRLAVLLQALGMGENAGEEVNCG